jgi:hypothetical protein
MIRIYALIILVFLSRGARTYELKELAVEEVDGGYRLQIVTVLDAPVEYVSKVITDYKRANQINPSISAVEILAFESDERVTVRNTSEHRIGPFSFSIDWVGDIVQAAPGNLKVHTIPGLGSFSSGSATWVIRPQGEHTWVQHESSLTPNFFIPPVIGDYFMKKHMEYDTLEVFDRIECHAKIMFEMDMENAPKMLEKLAAQRKDCVKSPGVIGPGGLRKSGTRAGD